MNLVMRRLDEEGIFTTEFGSVPLYRHTEKARLSVEPPQHNVPNVPNVPPEHPENLPDLPKVPEEEPEKKVPQEVGRSLTSVEMPVSEELEKRVALTEANLKSIETSMEKGFSKLETMITTQRPRLSLTPPTDDPTIPGKVNNPASSHWKGDTAF